MHPGETFRIDGFGIEFAHGVLRLVIPQKDGEPLLLTDYASCGKHWERKNNRITVWMNVE